MQRPTPLFAQIVRRHTREAYEVAALMGRTWLESAGLVRIGPDAIAANPDGIRLNCPMVRALYTVGLFNPLEVAVRGSKMLRVWRGVRFAFRGS